MPLNKLRTALLQIKVQSTERRELWGQPKGGEGRSSCPTATKMEASTLRHHGDRAEVTWYDCSDRGHMVWDCKREENKRIQCFFCKKYITHKKPDYPQRRLYMESRYLNTRDRSKRSDSRKSWYAGRGGQVSRDSRVIAEEVVAVTITDTEGKMPSERRGGIKKPTNTHKCR